MKAVYLEAPMDVKMIEVEKPVRKKGEALIKIISVSFCGSDVGAYRGANPLVNYPTILGHELAGEVVEIDDNEAGIKVGDRVIIDPYVYCNHCYPCSVGRTNCCEDLKVLGVQTQGGMAEYITHPDYLLNKVPDNIPLELIPLAEPLTISLHGLHRLKVKAGEHVAIIGAGPIGLLAALAAKTYGAYPILIDLVEERLLLAKEHGVDHIINIQKENAIERIREITNNRLCECVLEVSGSNPGIKSAFEYASYAGRVALTGWPKHDTELNTGLFTKKELDIVGARTSKGEFEEALELISTGKVDVSMVLSKVVKFDDMAKALVDLSEHPDQYLKIACVL